ETARGFPLHQVGTRYVVAEGEQHLRDAAHAVAADSDEMYVDRVFRHRTGFLHGPRRPPAPSHQPRHVLPDLAKHARLRKSSTLLRTENQCRVSVAHRSATRSAASGRPNRRAAAAIAVRTGASRTRSSRAAAMRAAVSSDSS